MTSKAATLPPRPPTGFAGRATPAQVLALALAAMAWCTAPPSRAQDAEFDTALIVSVDVSGSVDAQRYRLQMDGIAAALEDREVIDTILSGPRGGIVVTLVAWSDGLQQVLPWTPVSSREAAQELARRVRALPPYGGEFTCLGRMLGRLAEGLVPEIRPRALRVVAEFGVVLLLFQVGLESTVSEMRRVAGPGGREPHLTAGGKILSLRPAAGKPQEIVSDSTWLCSPEAGEGWQKLGFTAESWQPVQIVAPYARAPAAWRHPIWQSIVARQSGRILWPLINPNSAGNVSCQGAGVLGGYGFLDVASTGQPAALGIDPDDDNTYLRYARDNPLAQAGADKAPAGVPPLE